MLAARAAPGRGTARNNGGVPLNSHADAAACGRRSIAEPRPMPERPPLDCAVLSHPGMVRTHNEDSVFVDADGRHRGARRRHGRLQRRRSRERHRGQRRQQRHAAGARVRTASCRRSTSRAASRTRRCCCSSRSPRPTRASTRRRRRAPSAPAWARRSSAVVFCGNRVSIGHIGDSRCYRLRGEKFEQLTHDHSLLQEQIDSGQLTPEQARYSLNKNLVTRALGIEAIVPADIVEYRAEANDIYLLNSDGLTDMVEPDVVHSIIDEEARRPGRGRRGADRPRQPERRARQHLRRAGPRAEGVPAERRVGAALAREEARGLGRAVGKLVHFHADGTTLEIRLDRAADHDRAPRRQRHLPAVSGRERRACGRRDDPRRFVPRGPRQHQRHARQRQADRQALPARPRPDRHRAADPRLRRRRCGDARGAAGIGRSPPRTSPAAAERADATPSAPAALRAKRRSDASRRAPLGRRRAGNAAAAPIASSGPSPPISKPRRGARPRRRRPAPAAAAPPPPPPRHDRTADARAQGRRAAPRRGASSRWSRTRR